MKKDGKVATAVPLDPPHPTSVSAGFKRCVRAVMNPRILDRFRTRWVDITITLVTDGQKPPSQTVPALLRRGKLYANNVTFWLPGEGVELYGSIVEFEGKAWKSFGFGGLCMGAIDICIRGWDGSHGPSGDNSSANSEQ